MQSNPREAVRRARLAFRRLFLSRRTRTDAEPAAENGFSTEEVVLRFRIPVYLGLEHAKAAIAQSQTLGKHEELRNKC